jgi:hypothetical protein
MRCSVLARPNLKLFLFGAVVLLIVQDLVTQGHSQTTVVHARARPVPDQTLKEWLAQASESNSACG